MMSRTVPSGSDAGLNVPVMSTDAHDGKRQRTLHSTRSRHRYVDGAALALNEGEACR